MPPLEKINHYLIRASLGCGGMGQVFRAFDPVLEREVAIKVLHPHLSQDRQWAERLLNEAKAAAKLVHPNVVTIYEVGQAEQGRYLAMEFVDGVPLAALIGPSQGMSPDHALPLVQQLLKGLAYAHSQGTLHCDIKAENILVTKQGIAKILDFGIAKLKDVPPTPAADTLMGTVEYMAPEQILGEAVDHRADLYAVGVVLYVMLSARVPFRGESAVTVVYKQLNEEPLPPSSFNPEVTPELDEIVLKALAKPVEARYQSAEEFLRVIEGYLERRRLAELTRQLRAREIATNDGATEPGESTEGRPPDSVFVGREKEVKKLRSLMVKAKEGHGQTVLLMGEAGVGKTTLSERLRQFAELQGLWVLKGQCLYQEGLEPYLPYIDAIRDFFTGDHPELPEEERSNLKERVREVAPLLAEFTDRFHTTLGFNAGPATVPPHADRRNLLDDIAQLVGVLSHHRPVLFILDDLQWADEASLRLFHYLARQIPKAAIMLLGISRSDRHDLHPGGKPSVAIETFQRMRRESLFEEIHLSPLSREEHDRLVDLVLGSTELSEEFYQIIYEETKGNPFFLLETLKHLEARGDIRRENGVWRDRENIALESIPDRVEDIFLSRLRAIGEQDRETLQLASVIGLKFDPSLLSDVLGKSKIHLLKRLFRLERDFQVIRSVDDHYQFEHPLLREILYSELPPVLREEYHRLLAKEMLRRHGEDAGSYLGEIAYHLRHGGLHRRAVPYLFKAGSRAFKLSAYREAIAFFEDALQSEKKAGQKLLTTDMEKQLFLWLGISYEETGRWDEALNALERALRLSEATKDIEGQIGALRRRGRIYDKRSNWEQALECYQRCLGLLEQKKIPNVESRLLNNIGIVYFERGEYPKALQYFERTLRCDDDPNVAYDKAHALTNLGILHNIQGEYEKALENYKKAAAIYESRSDKHSLARVYQNLGMTYSDRGDWENSIRAFTQCLTLAEASGDKQLKALAYLNLGKAYLRQENLPKAEELVRKALKMFRRMKDDLSVAEVFHVFGLIASARGNTTQAEKYFEESITLNERARYTEGLAEAYLSYGTMCGEVGDFERAARYLKTSEELYAQLCSPTKVIEAQRALASLEEMAAQGDVKIVRDTYAVNFSQ